MVIISCIAPTFLGLQESFSYIFVQIEKDGIKLGLGLSKW